MTIGEAPGREEDGAGRPFIGQAGREFNENYLSLAGLYRDEVYVTNTVKCRPDLNRKPSKTEALGCAGHFIPQELEQVNPEVVVLMGATACALIEGDHAIDLEADHGIPRLGELYGWAGWIVPMYHPASGLHDTSMMTPMLEDWEALGKWLNAGVWSWPLESTTRDYKLVKCVADIDDSVPYARVEGIGFDTESQEGRPYSFQYSLAPGSARMVMLKDEELVRSAVGLLNSLGKHTWIAMHYAPADLPIADMLGLKVRNLRDSMLEAYGFGNLGRLGLKALAKRVLGRTRLSWEETVTPYSKEVLAQWMMNCFVHAETQWYTEVPRFHKKSGKPLTPTIVRSVPEKLLPELLSHSLKNTDYPIWQKLYERMPPEWMEKLVDVCGLVPVRGIAHCPIDVQIEYACSDPDDTRQLVIEFERRRREFETVLNVQDEDYDA